MPFELELCPQHCYALLSNLMFAGISRMIFMPVCLVWACMTQDGKNDLMGCCWLAFTFAYSWFHLYWQTLQGEYWSLTFSHLAVLNKSVLQMLWTHFCQQLTIWTYGWVITIKSSMAWVALPKRIFLSTCLVSIWSQEFRILHQLLYQRSE